MLGIPYTLPQIAEACGARDLFQGAKQQLPLRFISHDTRTLSSGAETLFVALVTPARDGHAYVRQAWERGVRNFLVSSHIDLPEVNYILCDDTLGALQHWAMVHRSQFSYPVIGITGSNGKTTVKEWLATLLEPSMQLVKSPLSYNSQLGVPLSLLQLRPGADLALIEAGISRAGEMEVLHAMIRPTIGILTHMGAAHADGFTSDEHKLREKALLFEGCETVIALEREQEMLKAIGLAVAPPLQVCCPSTTLGEQQTWRGGRGVRPALEENRALAILAARYLGLSEAEIEARLPLLHPVEMRTEIISDAPGLTIINDSYNADPDSVRAAFQLLAANGAQPNRRVILSDVEHLGQHQRTVQEELIRQAETLFGAANVITVGPVFAALRDNAANAFPDAEALMAGLGSFPFERCTVLLKGARRYQLERLIPLLQRKPNATVYEINLDALTNNFRHLKSLVPPHTRAMCMVKAASYGGGTWEIAQALASAGTDYLAVAYVSEGVELRERGITTPIMVMNPDGSGLHALCQHRLEPEIFDLDLLERYIRTARLAGLQTYPLHLKFDTGMGRLGFSEAELPALCEVVLQYPDIQVVSVMSHLAAADEPDMDDFTHAQAERFLRMSATFSGRTGLHPWRHILNTAGIERFPQYAFDMVRLGIGLYSGREEIGRLVSTVSQVHPYPAGTSVGYGRSTVLARDSRIATIPIGYADGIPRNLSNGKIAFLVHGQPAPVVGRVCMDMLMLDVTDIPATSTGSEVVLWGRQGDAFLSIHTVAKAAETIAYELLVRVSPRVRRVYVRE